MKLTPRGEALAVAAVLLLILFVLAVVGGIDVTTSLPNDR